MSVFKGLRQFVNGGSIYAATPPNEPHQCILTHFNHCYFSKAQIVCSLMMVFHTETC